MVLGLSVVVVAGPVPAETVAGPAMDNVESASLEPLAAEPGAALVALKEEVEALREKLASLSEAREAGDPALSLATHLTRIGNLIGLAALSVGIVSIVLLLSSWVEGRNVRRRLKADMDERLKHELARFARENDELRAQFRNDILGRLTEIDRLRVQARAEMLGVPFNSFVQEVANVTGSAETTYEGSVDHVSVAVEALMRASELERLLLSLQNGEGSDVQRSLLELQEQFFELPPTDAELEQGWQGVLARYLARLRVDGRFRDDMAVQEFARFIREVFRHESADDWVQKMNQSVA